MSKPLTFSRFRTANVKRCETAFFPLAAWSASDWANAMAGEVGEACNEVKKFRRAETMLRPDQPGLDDACFREDLANELADVITYVDLLAASQGIDLEAALVRKFNQVSARVRSKVRL